MLVRQFIGDAILHQPASEPLISNPAFVERATGDSGRDTVHGPTLASLPKMPDALRAIKYAIDQVHVLDAIANGFSIQ